MWDPAMVPTAAEISLRLQGYVQLLHKNNEKSRWLRSEDMPIDRRRSRTQQWWLVRRVGQARKSRADKVRGI